MIMGSNCYVFIINYGDNKYFIKIYVCWEFFSSFCSFKINKVDCVVI